MYFYVGKENSQVKSTVWILWEITLFTYLADRNIYKRILWFLFFPQILEPYEIHLFNGKSE